MRVLFAATPAIALPTFVNLAQNPSIKLVALLTNPDRTQGRRGQLIAPPIKEEAIKLAIPVLQPEKLDEIVEQHIKALQPDLLICFAYGKIFKKSFLELFRLVGINVHPSLLPRWRGATPIPSAILAGDKETGISVQRLAQKMDSGAILVQEAFALKGDETTVSLSTYVANVAPNLLNKAIELMQSNPQLGKEQSEEGVSLCGLIKKKDALINFTTETAIEIERKVRAYNPWPLAYSFFNAKEFYIYETKALANGNNNKDEAGTIVACHKKNGIEVVTKEGRLAILKMQIAGKKVLSCSDFMNGQPNLLGCRLGQGV
jgi:methionyl-tRNA formyltransferase